MYVDRPDWIVVGDCVCCGDTLTVLCRDFDNADIPDVVVCDSCQADGRNAPVIAELERRAVRGLSRAQPMVDPAIQPVQTDQQPATVLCVAEYRVGQLIFRKGKTYHVKSRVGDVFEIYNDAAGSFASLHVDSLALIFQVVSYSPAVHTDAGKLLDALRLCVASLDQLLPYLAKVPADIGLLNSALIAGRAALASQGDAQ